MRKALSYILIFAFLTSLFDILDVSDLMLGNRAVFSSASQEDNGDYDSISDEGFSFISVSAFSISPFHYKVEFGPLPTEKLQKMAEIISPYNFYQTDLNRPPIA